jgi:cell division protein FtsQ
MHHGSGGKIGYSKSGYGFVSFLFSLLRSNLFLLSLIVSTVAAVVVVNFDSIITTQIPKFSLQKIEFDGNDRIQDILLLKSSGLRYKVNILQPSIAEVKKRLESLAWIKSAVVCRRFPHTIYIRVAERIPIAILQSKHKLYLVDADGVVLENDGVGNFENLPIVVGEGAEKDVHKFLSYLAKFPKIEKQLVFAVKIGKRRWNIKINRGITVKLPEKGVFHALGILEEISDSDGFFNSDIQTIDLRMLDRVVVTKKKRNAPAKQ